MNVLQTAVSLPVRMAVECNFALGTHYNLGVIHRSGSLHTIRSLYDLDSDGLGFRFFCFIFYYCVMYHEHAQTGLQETVLDKQTRNQTYDK